MVTVHGTKETALKSLPKGWKKIEGAMTAPLGYYWASNGKSRFSAEYKKALIRDKAYWDAEKKKDGYGYCKWARFVSDYGDYYSICKHPMWADQDITYCKWEKWSPVDKEIRYHRRCPYFEEGKPPKKTPVKKAPAKRKYVLRKLRTAADFRQTPITQDELLNSKVIVEYKYHINDDIQAHEYRVTKSGYEYHLNRRHYEYHTEATTGGKYRKYADTNVKTESEKVPQGRIDTLLRILNAIIRDYGKISRAGYYSTVQVIPIKVKKTPEKKAPPKKTTGKPSVKAVKKLVSQGKVKSGFVSRLGIRKQTPPPPKSKKADEARKAMLAGYRVSKSGKLYYETRENRTDKPHEKPRRGRKAPAKRGRK